MQRRANGDHLEDSVLFLLIIFVVVVKVDLCVGVVMVVCGRVVVVVVGEAVARARTMREALHAIEDSPSHRTTVTDPRFTDAGFGQAKDDKGRTCAVVLLASWPRKAP